MTEQCGLQDRISETSPARKRLSLRWLLILLGALMLAFLLVGAISRIGGNATPLTPAESGSIQAELNQTLRLRDWEMTVTGVERPGSILLWSSLGNQSHAVGTWVIVPVTLTNHATGRLVVDRSDFVLLDSAGMTYDPASDDGAAHAYSFYRGGTTLARTAVVAGASATFYVVFDVPSTIQGLRVQFKQDRQPVINLGQ